MFTGLESGLGLEIVLALQSTQNGLFDFVAAVLHAMGNDLFYLLVITLIFWTVDRRLGTHLLFAIIFAGAINISLKFLFQSPRPFVVSDAVVPVVEQLGYGIPSGHVMNSLVFWGYFAYYVGKRWLFWLLAIYLLLMAWSRMYAGVHYPQDVIGAAVFGLPTLWMFTRLIEYVPPIWKRFPTIPQVALTTLIGLLMFIFLFTDESGPPVAGVMIGVGIGMILERQFVHFKNPEEIARRAAMYAIGITIVMAVFFGLRYVLAPLAPEGTVLEAALRVVRYAFVALIAYFGITWLGVRLNLLPVAPEDKNPAVSN